MIRSTSLFGPLLGVFLLEDVITGIEICLLILTVIYMVRVLFPGEAGRDADARNQRRRMERKSSARKAERFNVGDSGVTWPDRRASLPRRSNTGELFSEDSLAERGVFLNMLKLSSSPFNVGSLVSLPKRALDSQRVAFVS